MKTAAEKPLSNVAVRIFTVEERGGSPVPEVALDVSAVTSSGESRLLTTVVADANGYASLKLDAAAVASISQLSVAHGGGEKPFAISLQDLQNGVDTFRIPVSAAAAAAPRAGLVSVVDPDVRDAILSPGSIGLIPQLRIGGGFCRQLMPTTIGVRRYGAFQVHADICNPQTIECPNGNRTRYVRGKVLEYEIAWHPLGSSLGNLLNSITLAPCERVSVVVADWMRQETALREESSQLQQQATELVSHERVIMESLDSDVRTKSLAGAFATSGGATFPIKKVNVTATAGGGVSGSLSVQQVAATTTSRLAEHITQASTLVASRRSSVVFQATASERRFYQTRDIVNHNKCHSLTLFYYQVNENFNVVTDYKGERDVILIEYPNIEFDARRAYCNARVLKAALLDESLANCFDELGEALFCCQETPKGADVRMESVTLTMNVAAISNILSLTVTLLTTLGPIQLPGIIVAGWQPGVHTETLALPAPIDPAIVHGVVIAENGPGFGVHVLFVNELTLTYQATGIANPLGLFSTQTPFAINRFWSAEVKAEVPPPDPGRNECVEKSCCIQKLLGHLNCAGNRRYYNDAVFLSEDPNDRVMRWSCCRGADGPVDLISLIENTPIAVYGDFLVFAVAGSALVDDPSVRPVSRLVTIPTPGVYSEAILGQCDSCEILDPKRFTDWKCCDPAPTPSFPDPQSGVTPDDLKPEPITNQINFSTLPTSPDSVLKTLLETLLTNAKDGSEEAKALLDKVLDLVKEAVGKG
jgi:hypothetical protein